MIPRKYLLILIGAFSVLLLGLAACSSSASPTPTTMPPTAEAMAAETPTTETPTTEAATTEAISAASTDDFLNRAMNGEFKGTTVTGTGPFVGPDADKFNATMADFEQQTGITIEYNGSKEFEANIKAAIEGGNAPDIIDFPQPGLLATFVNEDKIIDLSQQFSQTTIDDIKANYNPSNCLKINVTQ